jgi:hypothetical protein
MRAFLLQLALDLLGLVMVPVWIIFGVSMLLTFAVCMPFELLLDGEEPYVG